MFQSTWCERHPHDCVHKQDLVEREWLRSREFGFGFFDLAVTAAIVGAIIMGAL